MKTKRTWKITWVVTIAQAIESSKSAKILWGKVKTKTTK